MRVKLKEIGKIVTGNTPSKQNTLYYNSNDILFIKPDVLQLKKVCDINDSKEFISENARAVSRIVPKGSLLITCIGIIGKIGIVDIDECAFNQQINAIVPNYNIKSKYLAYVLFYNRGRLNDIANAPVVPIINKSEFENFEVNIIDDIKKQENIIQILDKIENIIYKYECILKALDTLIKARFVEMFGDVVKNTKNWKTKKLNELCGFNNNKLGVDSIHNKVWLLNLDMIESDSGKIIDYYMIDEKEVPPSTISFNENCVLYSKLRPYLNKVVIPIKSGYATSELIAIETNSLIDKYFLAFALRSKSFVDMINLTSHGAKMPRASVDALKNFYIPVPDIEIQNTFATFVKQVDKLKFDVQKSLEKTQMLFNSLMQEYFG